MTGTPSWREADPYTDPEWLIWAKGAMRALRRRGEGRQESGSYVVDLDALKADIRLALHFDQKGITPRTPCWKCGATQPAHYCAPERQARDRLREFVRGDA